MSERSTGTGTGNRGHRTRWQTALALGRVSNLPTVWTNVLAGLALSGVSFARTDGWIAAAALGAALSLFYVGGMYLNDGFDRRWDAQHRPDRPIPAGDAAAPAVFAAGFAMMGAGLALLALAAALRPAPIAGGLALGALIIAYNRWHKGNPAAPLLMAACRAMIYVIAGLTAGGLGGLLALGVLALLAHVAVLTAIARHEAGDPRLPGRVALLIAAICLLDAAWLALTRNWLAAVVAAACFFATRRLQRRIAGT